MDPITQQGLAGAAGAGGEPTYVDDVFSTYLYDGTAATQTITNGIDLSGEGGLTWIKRRSAADPHQLYDTERGANKLLRSDRTSEEVTSFSDLLTSFNSDGFSLGADSGGFGTNPSSSTMVSWSFRKAPGFFDIVTYTGTGSTQNISHSLGSTPGLIIIKCTSSAFNWTVWHRSLATNQFLRLNSTGIASTSSAHVPSVSSTTFTCGGDDEVNGNNRTYVAYIFAHDDQSFGTDSDEAIIKCGTYTGNGSATGPEIDLGFEPQFIMVKLTQDADSLTGPWYLQDAIRNGAVTSNVTNALTANASSAESATAPNLGVTATGFQPRNTSSYVNRNGSTYIYMAIRRSHKPPETATEVFDVGLRSGSSSDSKITSNIFTDMSFIFRRDSSSEYNGLASRIQGHLSMPLNDYSAAGSGFVDVVSNKPWAHMTGFTVNGGNGAGNTGNLIDFSFKRAAGFFDAASYEGNAQDRTIAHNLKAVPEMIWVKGYNIAYDWFVYHKDVGNNAYINLNAGYASNNSSSMNLWDSTTPTSSVFSIRANNNVNYSGATFVAYLFASLDGVSKVGRYTGTGNTLDVDCGFSSGARFVMIKRYDASGQWYVWNSARGIVSGNDPYYQLNLTSAEVTNTDYIDPLNAGFTVTSSASNDLNANGGTYMFLAIA